MKTQMTFDNENKLIQATIIPETSEDEDMLKRFMIQVNMSHPMYNILDNIRHCVKELEG